MSKYIKIWLSLTIISFVSFHCKIKIPNKPNSMKEDNYEVYKTKLQKAIVIKDNFEIGIQLCNLGQSKETVYKHLRKGILENNQNCIQALRWNQYYVESNFKVNIIKLDTLAWKQLCILCQNDKKIVAEYEQVEKDRLRKYQESVKSLNIDSSKFDRELISILRIIHDDDQRYRGKDTSYWKKQIELDSINLKKVESIIKLRTYPSFREVGLDLATTIYLVLHHQPDILVRKKYLPYLEEAVKNNKLSQGLLELYNDRTKRMQ